MKKISVVMATYNRRKLAEKQIAAFYRQTLPMEYFEVIVVDDGSLDDTLKMLDKYSQSYPNFTYRTQAQKGPAVARNTGARIAQSPIIAFTDDDCIVEDTWLASILWAFEANPELVGVQGLTYTRKEERTPLTHQIENLTGHPAVPTCNVAYKKAAFETIGGFDESFPFAHNEDADLAWRMLEFGTIDFCSTMKVYHPPIAGSFTKQVKRLRMLQSEFALFNKNPKRYRLHRNQSAWVTIFKEVLLNHQFRLLKFHLSFFKRPKWLLTGLSLSLAQVGYLLWLLPTFVRFSSQMKHKNG